MSSPELARPAGEPPQRPRFGPIRETPPAEVVTLLRGAAPDSTWTIDRFGGDGGYPNGGIWRVSADRANGAGPASAWVKRTGASYLGESRVWRCRSAPQDPQWWGREAVFYESPLATSGWTTGTRPARCYAIDDHDDCRDLWLEDIEVPASIHVCTQAAFGLAGWQVRNRGATYSWLSNDWIPTHIGRHGLDNKRTLAHPAWPRLVERGLDRRVRDLVEVRVCDPAEIRRRLREFPHVLTHFDFHQANIGTVGDDTVIIDWAYVGGGPIGHDVGHLALDIDPDRGVSVREVWDAMQSAYCDGLAAAGWSDDLSVVRRSMAESNVLRLGWEIDYVLSVVDRVPDEKFAAFSDRLGLVAELH